MMSLCRCHLLHVQFACKHHNISKLRIEAECLGVGYVELRAQVDLHTRLIGVLHDGDVACDDGIHACQLRFVHYGAH